MVDSLLEKLMVRWPRERWRGLTVLVGCSGGADSTALLLALHELRPDKTTILAAHFNHQLRGEESDEDERYVRDLAARLGSPFLRGSRLEEEQQGEGVRGKASEAAMREMRYRFLRRVASQAGARYVAVAHTADDSVETVLHHLVRGTGLSGLTGIPPFRHLDDELVLIRPLLDVWRDEVVAFLEQRHQPYRNDSSNASLGYTRNRIRHRWLPMLEAEAGGGVRQAIHRTSGILSELQGWLHRQARLWLDRHVVGRSATRVELAVGDFQDSDWPLVQNALTLLWQEQEWPLMAMTHHHWTQLRTFLRPTSAEFPEFELPSRIRVRRDRERVIAEKPFIFERVS